MKSTTALSALFAAALLFAAGCKNNPTDDSGGTNRKDLLVGSWLTTSVTANGFDAIDSYADHTTFRSDGTYTSTYPAADAEDGIWSLTNSDTKLLMDAGSDESGTWDILELTSTKLHMKSNLVLQGQDLLVDFTATRQ